MTEEVQYPLTFDSEREQVGKLYASALLRVTEKAGVSELTLEELASFVDDVLARSPKFAAVLASPRVAHEEKERLLDRAVGGTMNRPLLNFLKVASRHGRLDCLKEVLAAARKQFNELRGRVAVDVESAVPLDDALRAAIAERLRQSLRAEIELRPHVNPELVAGLVVRVGDTVYDASVANQLGRLRQTVLANAQQAMRKSVARFASAE
jgi:F-type H+-transporting ATPase subunit delta